jgi:3-methyladenine DNA glycosylase AlkD
MTPRHYLSQIEQALTPLANGEKAVGMRAYLKDQFDFLGIAAPVRRAAIKALPKAAFTADELLDLAKKLWKKPQREYRYTAIDLLRQHNRLLQIEHLPQLQQLALNKPWWETIDGLSVVIGNIIRHAREQDCNAQKITDEWLHHDSFWQRRIAMLHQLGWRLDTDSERLFHYADTLASENEFFIRKAIGWALRNYARWNPQAVKRYVKRNEQHLSGLSVREALKHL